MSHMLLKRISLLIVLVVFIANPAMAGNEKLAFWNQQRKGAHGDGGTSRGSGTHPEEWFQAAAEAGLEFIRLCPVDWESQDRDFLLGDADHFTAIPEQDLVQLETVLDVAHRNNMKVVLTMFSLPGARNRQDNNNQFDYRLWTNEAYQQQALTFWKDLAARLKDHPAIVGYNPLNEPHPARKDGFEGGEDMDGFEKWLLQHKDTTSDLNRFNRLVVDAIRSEDLETPIILDCWFHSDPEGFSYLTPVNDDAVLYAFHTYGPWNFATFRINKGRFSYPDKMPVGWSGETEAWTITDLRHLVEPVIEWAQRHHVPVSRIIAEEFGCGRRVAGAQEFLADLLTVFNGEGWHWAFYSFRSSTWDGLDYELGTKKLGWKYWEGRDQGISHEQLITRHDNPLWDVFQRELSK